MQYQRNIVGLGKARDWGGVGKRLTLQFKFPRRITGLV